jgi:hypothetical protein
MPPHASERLCYYFHLKEVQMDRTVDVTIPVEPEAVAELADACNREAMGRLVSRVLRPVEPEAVAELADAQPRGDGSPGKPRAAAALGSEPPRSGDRRTEG